MAQPQTDWSARIREIEARVAALEQRLADPATAQKPGELARVGKELADLRPVLEAGDAYRKVLKAIADNEEMARDADPELSALAQAELPELEAKRDQLVHDIRLLLIPKDPTDERDAILEIRAGTGGEEAALFAADLFRMYSRYAESKRWKIEPLSISETGSGGFKEIIVGISGKDVFGRLKHERGVHRVQRVPATEAAGRIHTSTVTVAILPEAEEVDITINPADLRIDVFRAGGPGGQSVNTTDSAVRVTHIPTGVVVSCQDEKSQHKNKAKALKVLRSRLLEAELERQANERASDRRAQVGTGDRSEKIRTYNYPQNRVTDHRAGITLHQLDRVMEGGVDELLDGVASYMTAEREKQLAPKESPPEDSPRA
jgi:peptide chain release factor 1